MAVSFELDESVKRAYRPEELKLLAGHTFLDHNYIKRTVEKVDGYVWINSFAYTGSELLYYFGLGIYLE
jgi:hypothetical protein